MKQRLLSPSGFRPIPRRGLSRTEAAIYIGISSTKFDQMVTDGRMPKPRRIDARRVWDIRTLDDAFNALPGGEDHIERNPWDDIYLTGGSSNALNERNPPIEFKAYTPEEWKQIVLAQDQWAIQPSASEGASPRDAQSSPCRQSTD